MSHRVVVPAGVLLLGAALCCAQTFEVAPHSDASRTSGATGPAKARAAPPTAENTLGWGSGLEVAQQARAAQAELSAGDYTAASAHAERAARAAPQNADLWFLFGYAARLAGRYQASADAFQRGLAVRPASVQGLAGLAQTYDKMGRRDDARRLLLAYGLRDVWTDIPGLTHVYGANAHVCPDCDGHEARGKKVVVIGNGRRAAGMALDLSTWTDRIIVSTNGMPPDLDGEYCEKLDALNIPVLTQRVRRVSYAGKSISCLELENDMLLDADKIFFSLAQYPSDDLGALLECDRDEGGHIIVDEHLHTSVTNVYAAGDLIPGAQLAVAAAADGAIAAIAMHKSLVPMTRRLEPMIPEEAAATAGP